MPDIVLDEGALAKVGALAQPGQHSALAAGGLGDDDGALLDDVEAVAALALPEDGLPRPELHRLQRARDQLPVVLQRPPRQPSALLQLTMGSEHMHVGSLKACKGQAFGCPASAAVAVWHSTSHSSVKLILSLLQLASGWARLELMLSLMQRPGHAQKEKGVAVAS